MCTHLPIQHPVLTLGDGLGSRVVLHEGSSTHSGNYVVEECDSSESGEGVRVRRLVFLTSQHLAQTEVHMVPGMFLCACIINYNLCIYSGSHILCKHALVVTYTEVDQKTTFYVTFLF